jgi:hypothetical protein
MNPEQDWQRKIKILTTIDGIIMPLCPELCPDSQLSILENYVIQNKHTLKTVYIKNNCLCVSSKYGMYEQTIGGTNQEHYEKAASDLLSRILTQHVPDKQSDILHGKKPEFTTEIEHLYWKKMTILKGRQVMIPEILPDTFLSKIEKHLISRGKLYVGYVNNIRDLCCNHIFYTITCTIILPDGENICQSTILPNQKLDMVPLEEMFEKMYFHPKLDIEHKMGLIDGKVYFVVPSNSGYRMMDIHMGVYNSRTQHLGNRPIHQSIKLHHSTLTRFREYKPFVPDVDREILYGKQIHELWLLGPSWAREILVEFEGIQFGYPAYRMYVNNEIVNIISYRDGRFIDDTGAHINLSM